MRIGILTGGGDCPGLNAVIRAVGQRSFDNGHEMVGCARAGVASSTACFAPLGRQRDLGHPAPRRHDSRHHAARTRSRSTAASTPCSRTSRPSVSTRSSRSAARTRSALRRACTRARLPRRRRSEDDRQRPLGHRLHVRLRHRRHDRDRGDRPPAHDRRVAQPRDGRRGDGPAHGLDRGHERHRGRRRRDPHPRAADHRRGRVRVS